jgi:hypothetical protein
LSGCWRRSRRGWLRGASQQARPDPLGDDEDRRMLPHRDVCEGVRKPLVAATRVHRGDLQVGVWQAQRNVMNDTVATEDQEQPASAHELKARITDRDPGRRTASRPAEICSAQTGRTYDRSRPNRSKRKKCLPSGPFSNRISLVNGFVAAPGHGSLRGRNNPPQHLVRSTGAAMPFLRASRIWRWRSARAASSGLRAMTMRVDKGFELGSPAPSINTRTSSMFCSFGMFCKCAIRSNFALHGSRKRKERQRSRTT